MFLIVTPHLSSSSCLCLWFSSVAPISDAYLKAAWDVLHNTAGTASPLDTGMFVAVDEALAEVDAKHTPLYAGDAPSPPTTTAPAPATSPATGGASGTAGGLDDATMALLASAPAPPTHVPTSRPVLHQFRHWDVDHNRFELKRLLGKGSYGAVAEAIDHTYPLSLCVCVYDVYFL